MIEYKLCKDGNAWDYNLSYWISAHNTQRYGISPVCDDLTFDVKYVLTIEHTSDHNNLTLAEAIEFIGDTPDRLRIGILADNTYILNLFIDALDH